MVKVKLTLTVDDQLIARARTMGVNLSSLLEDVLRGDELRRRRSSADLSAPM
jgi:post-segregation antitoxin (ccd killing protein)